MDISLGAIAGIIVGMIHLNARAISKVDDRVDKVPETYLTKKDFNRFDDRLFQELRDMREDIKNESK